LDSRHYPENPRGSEQNLLRDQSCRDPSARAGISSATRSEPRTNWCAAAQKTSTRAFRTRSAAESSNRSTARALRAGRARRVA